MELLWARRSELRFIAARLVVISDRTLVLAAARRVFLARGYAGATLEVIADEAGFSKGVVYSQFDSKADLFLELLAARICERAEQHERLALALGGGRLVQAAAELTDSLHQAEPEWSLLADPAADQVRAG